MKRFFKFFLILLSFPVFFLYSPNRVYASSNPVHWAISGQKISYASPTKVIFEDTSVVNHVITTYDSMLDVSVSGEEGTVVEYLVDGVLYVQFNGTLYLNANSANLFALGSKLVSIEGLEYVNTSEVTSMNSMFSGCSNLTSIDLSHFDTSHVTNMSSMFSRMRSLTSINVSNFNTSNVTNMAYMFQDLSSITSLNVSNFNTSNVTNMASMFKNLTNISTLNISNFTTSSVTNMSGMFAGMSSLTSLNLTSFNTSLVTDMSEMFSGCSKLTNLNISSFQTNQVTNMSSMFASLSKITSLNVTHFNTSSVTDMSNMFYNMSSLTSLDISNFNTSNVVNMSGMFSLMTSLTSLNVSNFNTSKVTDMSNMFSHLNISSLDVSHFDTSLVTNMSEMFSEMTNISTLDLSSFNTSNVSNMSSMFYNDTSLTHIYVTLLWDNSNVSEGTSMFYNNISLSVENGTKFTTRHIDSNYARIDTYYRAGYLSVHWDISSSLYLIDFTNYTIDAQQNLFDVTTISHSNNVTLSVIDGYVDVLYDNSIHIRQFRIIQPILSVTLNKHSALMIRGKSLQLSADIYPTTTTYDQTLTWSSSNNSVLTVTSDGTVRAVGAGTATITVSTVNVHNDSHSDTCTIEVTVPVTSFEHETFSPNANELVLTPGKTYQLNPTIGPSDTSEPKTVTWSWEFVSSKRSDHNIISINSDGLLTALAPGHVTVTGKLNSSRFLPVADGDVDDLIYGQSITFDVWVQIPIDSINIVENQVNLYIGDSNYETKSLSVEYSPTDYEEDGTITWSSSNTSVATVNNSGVVTAKRLDGTSTIQAKVPNGKKDTVPVTVKILATDFTITNNGSDEKTVLEIGQTHTIATSITPTDSSYKTITWSSSNTSVATVDSNGKVTAKHEGETVISGVLSNGLNRDLTVERTVKVLIPIREFSVDESNVTLNIGDPAQETATLHPRFNPTSFEVDGTIDWSSSDPSIVSVDSNGVLTVNSNRKTGDVTITAKLHNYPLLSDTVSVHVDIIILDFQLKNAADVTLELGSSHTIQTDILPHDATVSKEIVWTSDDTTVATVSNGVVSTVGTGTTTIHGRVGNFQISVTVHVIISITVFEVDKTSLNLLPNDSYTLQTTIGPSNTTESKVITWESSNPSVATVNNGVISSISPGTCKITGSLSNGLKVEVSVKVLIPIESISLSPSSFTLYRDDSSRDHKTVAATITPSTAEEDASITWSSQNTSLVSVDQNGVVRVVGLSPDGNNTTTITATLPNGMTATSTVTVEALISSFQVKNGSDLRLELNQTHTVTTEILPIDTTEDKTIIWESNNPSIATVDSNGTITAVGVGTTNVTGTLTNGKKVTVVVKVLKPINSVQMAYDSLTLYKGDSTRDHQLLDVIIDPSDAEVDKTITWTSNDTSIATVDTSGVVHAVGAGTTTVVGTLKNNMSVECTIIVESVITDFHVTNGDNISIRMSDNPNHTIQTFIGPLDATESKVITWSSSDDGIASVDNGVVTAHQAGTVVVTGLLQNSMSVNVTVKVLKEITNFTLADDTITLFKGDSTKDNKTLSYSILPTDHDEDASITWSSGDSSIATVSDGVVHAVGAGETIITATLPNGLSDTCVVNVQSLITGFVIDGDTEIYLGKGKTHTIETIITPDDATENKKITWTSNNTSVATVDRYGKVTGVASGDAVITGTLTNGMSVSLTVHISVPITKFSISNSHVEIMPDQEKQLSVSISPSNTTEDKTVTWSSEDSSIASISSTGLVTGHALGTTTITATLSNGMTATTTVIVTMTPSSRIRGDFDDNGKVDISDVIVALRKVFKYVAIVEDDYAIGDLNGDSKIDISDIIILLRYVFKYIDSI